jgi:Tol biopolymer transport system component
MGEVYRARDTRLGRDVALKVVHPRLATDPERLSRFEKEARAAAQLDHPNILVVHDIGAHEGSPFIVSELLEGQSLREKLGEPLPPKKAVEYAVQVAHGLAAAHEKGIVHRDIKPENVFVTKDGHVKILDFGLAKLIQPSIPSVSLTEALTATPTTDANVIMGTVGYMSPEQVMGKPLDARSDLFSLGVVLYEMLSGKRPFQKDTAAETMAAILKEEPPELSGTDKPVPPGLDRIVRHCLEKEPSSRFQTARDVGFALESLSQATTAGTAPLRAGGRRRRLAVAALGITLAVGLVGFFLLGRRSATLASPTFQKLTFGKGWVGAARFTADGNSIVYSARWEDRDLQLHTSRLDAPVANTVEPGQALVVGIHGGEMAVLLPPEIGSSRAQQYSRGWLLATLPVGGGTPRPVLEGVFAADWSPDGKAFAVVRSDGGRRRLEFPPGHVLFETAGGIGSPRISPRGDYVAFAHSRVTGDIAGSVDVVDSSGKLTILSDGWGGVQSVAWRPDGREVWFSAGRIWGWYSVHAVTLDGKLRTVLEAAGSLELKDVFRDGRVLLSSGTITNEIWGRGPGDSAERSFSWLDGSGAFGVSADGTSLLLCEVSVGGGPTRSVFLRRLDGSVPVRLGAGRARGLSPDGAWALSTLQAPEPALLAIPTGAGETRRLPRGSLAGYHWASFFPDGRRILIVGHEAGRPMRLFVQDVASGGPRPLSAEGFRVPEPSACVSPDGKWIVATPEGGTAAPVLLPVDGGEPRPVEGLGATDIPIAFSQDGRSLFVRESAPIRLARVVRFDLGTRTRTLWKELRPRDPSGAWFVYQPVLARDGEVYFYTLIRELDNLYLVDGLR